MKIAVGTKSEQKLGYLKEVLEDIGVKAELVSVEVESGISNQPLTEAETQAGSLNRAKAALAKAPSADFSLGIEVGYHPTKAGDYQMFCCVSIVDKGGFATSCFSSNFLLPKFHQGVLKEGKYLGDYVREYEKDIDEPVTNYIRELVRGRKPLIIEAARNALLMYLKKEEF
jgi:non-canonical (house-cleaning) NTP pyrophosphatase